MVTSSGPHEHEHDPPARSRTPTGRALRPASIFMARHGICCIAVMPDECVAHLPARSRKFRPRPPNAVAVCHMACHDDGAPARVVAEADHARARVGRRTGQHVLCDASHNPHTHATIISMMRCHSGMICRHEGRPAGALAQPPSHGGRGATVVCCLLRAGFREMARCDITGRCQTLCTRSRRAPLADAP